MHKESIAAPSSQITKASFAPSQGPYRNGLTCPLLQQYMLNSCASRLLKNYWLLVHLYLSFSSISNHGEYNKIRPHQGWILTYQLKEITQPELDLVKSKTSTFYNKSLELPGSASQAPGVSYTDESVF